MFRDSPQPHRSETSYSSAPMPAGDSMVVNSDEMRTLLRHRRELDDSLAQLEAKIFHEEGAYIRETPCGNVIRGFDCFHDSKLNTEQPKKSRMEVIEERIFSKSSYLFWMKSCERAAKDDAKKREQQQAIIANRGMYMGSAVNGSAAGGGHVPTLNYGSSMHGGVVHSVPTALPATNHGISGHKSHKKRHPDGHSSSHKKKKKKRSSAPPSINSAYGGENSQSGDGNGAASSGSSMPGNRFDPM